MLFTAEQTVPKTRFVPILKLNAIFFNFICGPKCHKVSEKDTKWSEDDTKWSEDDTKWSESLYHVVYRLDLARRADNTCN